MTRTAPVNLLLRCSTAPDFSRDALDLWNNFCTADWMPGNDVVRYLLFARSSEFASIDAIVFLQPNMSVGFAEWADGSRIPWPEMTISEGHGRNAIISERIRNLPQTCAMRRGLAPTSQGHREGARYIPKSTQRALLIGRAPRHEDATLWEKRKAEQPSVRIITYDEVLQEQRDRLSRRRRR